MTVNNNIMADSIPTEIGLLTNLMLHDLGKWLHYVFPLCSETKQINDNKK